MMKKTNPAIYAIVLLLALLGLAYLGGLPDADEMPVFAIGASLLVGLGLVIAGLGWYLLYRPLPENYKISSESPVSPRMRQILAVLLVIMMTMVALGGAWDEAWHVLYGIPFGEDFFWRPHILIYLGLITLVFFAIGLSFVFLRNGKGTLAQRLRSDKLLAYLLFIGLFMVYALPADPIWHQIYGEDLTAFSIPHVMLGFIFVLPLFVAVGLLVSSQPNRNWQSILKMRWLDSVAIVAFVGMQLTLNMLFLTNWEVLTIAGGTPLDDIASMTPDWLFPLLAVFTSAFIAISANHSLRYYGSATLIALLGLGLRLLLLRLLGHELQTAYAWIMALVVHIGVDVAYAAFLRRGNAPKWWQSGLVAGATMAAFGLPIIHNFYPTPEISLNNLPFMLIACFGGALLAAWFAQAIGDYLAENPRHLPENSPKPQFAGVTGLAFLLSVLFVFWFVVTAIPPV